MASTEFPGLDLIASGVIDLPLEVRQLIWAKWDLIKDKEFHVKWGWFKFSVKYAQLEPVLVALIGPRPA